MTDTPSSKTPGVHATRHPWFWGIVVALILLIVGILTAAEFYAPIWVKQHMEKDLADTLKLDVSVGRVTTDAAEGILHMYDFKISDHGKLLVSFKEFHLNYSWTSLFSPVYLIEDATLIGPHIYAEIPLKGPLNLLKLVPPSTPENKNKKAPKWHIHKITIHDGLINFQDDRVKPARGGEISPLEFSLADIGTDSADGNAELHGDLIGGGQLDWVGNIRLDPFRSAGKLQVHNLGLAELMRWAPPDTPVQITQGKVSVLLDYNAIIAPDFAINLVKSGVALDNLRIQAGDEPIASLDTLNVNNISMSYPTKQWGIESIKVSGGSLQMSRGADGQLRLQKILAAQPKHVSADPAIAAAEAAEAADKKRGKHRHKAKSTEPIWAGSLKQADVDQVTLSFNDASTTPATRLSLGPLSLKATPSQQSSGQDVLTIALKTPLNTEGLLNLTGLVGMPTLQSNGVAAEPFFKGRLQTTNLNLNALEAYVRQAAQVRLPSARLTIAGDINWRPSAAPVWSWNGDTRLDQLSVLDGRDNQPLLSANAIVANALQVQGSPNRVHLSNLLLDTVFVRATMQTDGQLNLASLANKAANSAATQAASKAIKNAAAAVTEDPGWPTQIDTITLKGTNVLFSDQRQSPPYSQAIRNLNGQLVGIDLQSDKPTVIDLTGELPPLGKMVVNGNAALFAKKPVLDLTVKMQDVDLTALSPYTGRYAGYRIDKGRVDSNLHYTIRNDRLDAANHIVMREFNWGTSVDSPDATSLPVRLATALLKDTSGNIDIDIPLTGSLSDPEFRILPLVWKTLGNLITRAAAAPFKLLGSLIGGGSDDINEISFPAGSSTLTPAASSRLQKIATALKAKPELQLEVRGLTDAAVDKPAITQARLSKGTEKPATDNDLHLLAQARSTIILTTLTANGVPSAQVFRLDSGDTTAKNGQVEVGLTVKLP